LIDLLNYLAANPGWLLGAMGIVALFLFGPMILRQLSLVQANERYAEHKCVSCGYDLRGSEDRCPECGFPIQPPELPLMMPLSGNLLQEHGQAHGPVSGKKRSTKTANEKEEELRCPEAAAGRGRTAKCLTYSTKLVHRLKSVSTASP